MKGVPDTLFHATTRLRYELEYKKHGVITTSDDDCVYFTDSYREADIITVIRLMTDENYSPHKLKPAYEKYPELKDGIILEIDTTEIKHFMGYDPEDMFPAKEFSGKVNSQWYRHWGPVSLSYAIDITEIPFADRPSYYMDIMRAVAPQNKWSSYRKF